jgi:hypothetical protein
MLVTGAPVTSIPCEELKSLRKWLRQPPDANVITELRRRSDTDPLSAPKIS